MPVARHKVQTECPLTRDAMKAALVPVSHALKRAQETLDLAPISYEKARRRPEVFFKVVEELSAARDPARPSRDLKENLKNLAAFKKTQGGFVVRSAEVNLAGTRSRRVPLKIKRALEQQAARTDSAP